MCIILMKRKSLMMSFLRLYVHSHQCDNSRSAPSTSMNRIECMLGDSKNIATLFTTTTTGDQIRSVVWWLFLSRRNQCIIIINITARVGTKVPKVYTVYTSARIESRFNQSLHMKKDICIIKKVSNSQPRGILS